MRTQREMPCCMSSSTPKLEPCPNSSWVSQPGGLHIVRFSFASICAAFERLLTGPNIRMVDKMGAGRVFLAGGQETFSIVDNLTLMPPQTVLMFTVSLADKGQTLESKTLSILAGNSLCYCNAVHPFL